MKGRENSLYSGISLISVIITVAVSIIITGATVATLSEKNNILDNANKAKEEMEKNQYIEKSEMFINVLNIELAKINNHSKEGYYPLEKILEQLGMTCDDDIKNGWVFLKDNQILSYGFYYDTYLVSNIRGNSQVEEINSNNLINANFANVKEYGAVGDGETDDTNAIKEAVNYLNENGGFLYFPTGTYKTSITKSGDTVIDLKSKENVCIDFNNSTIILEENQYPSYQIIKTTDCNGVFVKDGNLIGDRILHDYNTISGTHEFGYGIFFYQSQNCEAYNMNISNMTGDAIIIKNGESSGKTIVNQCELHHSRRQGISVLDSDIVEILNTKVHNIGTWDNIKGTSPMTGIDIEPASGTKNVNSVLIDNVEIKDITSFGIINVNENLKDIKILNSEIYNPDVTNVDIKNTKIFYDHDNGRVIKNSNIENSYIKFDEKHTTLFMSNVNISNSKFEGDQENIGGRILGTNLKVNNTEFSYIRGTGDYSTNSKKDFGITFSADYKYKEGSSSNIYDNCSIIISNELKDNDSIIKNSYIYIDYGEVKLKKLNIQNCQTRSNMSATLELNDCEVSDSGNFGNCKKYLYNTHLLTDNLSDSAFKNGSVCNNSTIRIKGDMSIKALNYVTFSNGSKVILDKYNSNSKISNIYSTENKNYTVEYNGMENLQ